MEDITNYRKDYFSSATTKKKKKKKRKRFLLHRVNNARVTICITGSLVSLITTFPCGKTTCFLRTTTGPPTEHRETHATSHGSLLRSSFQKPELSREKGRKIYARWAG